MRTIDEIVVERRRIWNDNDMWSDGLDMIVNELINDHFKDNFENVIVFLEALDEKDFDMFTMFFEDFIHAYPQKELLDYLYLTIKKYPNLDIETDVKYAQEEYDMMISNYGA